MVHIKKKLKKKIKAACVCHFSCQMTLKKKGKKDVSNIQTGVKSFLLSNWLCRVNVLDTGS